MAVWPYIYPTPYMTVFMVILLPAIFTVYTPYIRINASGQPCPFATATRASLAHAQADVSEMVEERIEDLVASLYERLEDHASEMEEDTPLQVSFTIKKALASQWLSSFYPLYYPSDVVVA